MFARLFLAFLALLVLTLAAIALISAQTTRGRVLEEIELRLESQAASLRPYVASLPAPEGLQETIRRLGNDLDTRLTIVAPDGKVLADSQGDPAMMENHNSRPEVVCARSQGRGKNIRHSDTLHAEMMYHAVLLDPDQPRGVVIRSALPLTRVQEEVGAIYHGIVIAFLVIALIGTGLTYLLARWITRPLRQIQTVAQAIASGDFAQKAPLEAIGEIGDVARAINRMAEELSQRLDSLAAATAKLEAVIAGMQEAVIAVDRRGHIQHHNRAAQSVLDLHVDPMGLAVWDAVRLAGIEENVRKVLQERTTVRTILEIGSRVVGACICPIAATGGAVLVAHDATEDRRYDALRKEFVANVSHELRTPISIIQGYIETLKEGAWKDERRAHEFLETMEKHARRLGAIVEDLLQLSRLESAGQIAKPAWIEARAFFEKIREPFAPLAAKKRQTFSVEVELGLDAVKADPDLLERAIGNLIDNAIKYTSEGGRVHVKVESRAEAVIISVADTGIGIPEADLARVFERFYRVDKSRSRELGGTGLGLAIVKHIAQLHGGSISVQSRVGSGSVFTLSLPKPAQ